MEEITVPLNHLSIIASGIVGFGIGALWYGPLFGKTWMKLSGITFTKAQQKEAATLSFMVRSYGTTLIGAMVMAYVLAHSLVFASAYLQMTGISAGIMAGAWSWVGFIVPTSLASVLWEGKSWKLWFINTGYYLVELLAMGVILSLWQ